MLVIFVGCERDYEENLRLAVSPRIGYSLLYYAQEKGMLEDAGIKLIPSTSLHETMHYYQSNLINAFVSTQFEASMLKEENLVHYMAIDDSDGDVVLSNRSLETIIKNKRAKTYFEIDSINKLVFDDFIKKYHLSVSDFDLFNRAQVLLKDMVVSNKDDIVIITYEPYATVLRNSGFLEISSAADDGTFVLDSLYVNADFLKEHDKKLEKLKSIIKQSYLKFKEDPRAYYEVVKSYLENPTYEEFMKSSSTVKWLLNEPVSTLNKKLKSYNITPIRAE